MSFVDVRNRGKKEHVTHEVRQEEDRTRYYDCETFGLSLVLQYHRSRLLSWSSCLHEKTPTFLYFLSTMMIASHRLLVLCLALFGTILVAATSKVGNDNGRHRAVTFQGESLAKIHIPRPSDGSYQTLERFFEEHNTTGLLFGSNDIKPLANGKWVCRQPSFSLFGITMVPVSEWVCPRELKMAFSEWPFPFWIATLKWLEKAVYRTMSTRVGLLP